MTEIVVNARCLQRKVTGIQRYTKEVLSFFPKDLTLISPPKILSKNVLTNNLWEQFLLPLKLNDNLLWSPANIGPVLYKKQVVTIHDVMPLETDHHEFSCFFTMWYKKILPKLVANVRHIITISQFSADRIMQLLDIKADKISVIPCGIDHKKFYPRSEKAVKTLIKSKQIPSKKYILALSSMLAHKNFQSLLDAWQVLHKSLPEDVYLVLAGGIPRYGSYNFKNMPPRVHYLGYIDEEELPILYSGAMFFVFLSLYEGFGLTPLEAMACGTPVLSSNAASIPEVIKEAGIKVNPLAVDNIVKNIQLLYHDRKLRKELSFRGIENARSYNWQTTSQQVWQTLNHFA